MPYHIYVKVSDNIFTDNKLSSQSTSVVAHGVNTRGVMGAGFAKQVASRFPSVVAPYAAACSSGELTTGKSLVLLDEPSGVFVANVASQDKPGRYATMEWLRNGLLDMYRQMSTFRFAYKSQGVNKPPFEVRLPLIGGGIGGIDPVDAARVIFDTADMVRNVHPMLNGEPTVSSVTLYLRAGESHNAAVLNAFDAYYKEFPEGNYKPENLPKFSV